MIFTITELFRAIIITLAVGYIFKDLFRTQQFGFDIEAFKFACLVTGPAIVLHELGHKFVAIMFGFSATFYAAYMWLAIGIIMRLMHFPFIIFVPAYVSISEAAKALPLEYSAIAFAGPLVNLLIFCTASIVLQQKKLKRRTYLFWLITKKINLFLFVFNMLPIPAFDGFKVYQGLIQYFF